MQLNPQFMARRITVSLIFVLILTTVFAQEHKQKAVYLPAKHYFEPLILDPSESQSFGSLFAYWEDGQWEDKIYAPLALGFQLPVIQWDRGDYGFELGFMATVFFQFEFLKPTDVFLVNLINTDFKVGIPFVFRKGRFALRTTFFHVSSHFSEEYIFRYNLKNFGENRNTYEAFDFQASWQFEKFRPYAGVGIAVNSPYDREPWKFQAGFLYRTPVKKGSNFNYVAGADFQLLEETYWGINSMLGAGIEYDKTGRTFQLMAQYFNGCLPYSQYTRLKVQYVGLTLIGHPF